MRIAQSECALTSVRQLRKEVIEARHEGALLLHMDCLAEGADVRRVAGLDALIKGHIFVGVADLDSCISMIQHQTKLYLVNHASIG